MSAGGLGGAPFTAGGETGLQGVDRPRSGLLAWPSGGWAEMDMGPGGDLGSFGFYVAASVMAAALYELTAPKRACLGRCRQLAERGGEPMIPAGLRYGRDCVGCSVGLMLVLFALGVMSVVWMLAIAALVFVQRATPVGARSTLPIALLSTALAP